jgi:uncharacterized 2Fe-2S/4Fe-4S cluster protein (DUF4445 family)
VPKLTVVFGEKEVIIEVAQGSLLGEAIATTGLPLEQPCAGRGTCGKCKILVEEDVAPPDDIELAHLTPGELALDNRLACRARVQEDSRVVLTPIVVYSNKIFRTSHRYKQGDSPLGLAIDLGSTTVAAFLTMMDDGEVCAGSATLNQQTIYGADVISRLSAALDNPLNGERLHRLALASINQAVDSLKLSPRIRDRVERVTVVGNVAMHHLLACMPVNTLAVKPFQPFSKAAIKDATYFMGGIFPEDVRITLPPLIGGFVGSDALACLAYFGFDHTKSPMAAIDLGTNGEVLVTDGQRILTASTAAGPAFEGVFISCGTRAVDGAIVSASLKNGNLEFVTIGDEPPIGLTGSGLLSLVNVLREAGVIEASGRITSQLIPHAHSIEIDEDGRSRVRLTEDGRLGLTQRDIRELQKAKGAVRAAMETLMKRLDIKANELDRIILTGSFGGQIDISSAINLGLIPTVSLEKVQTLPNGAGFGAAIFLSDDGFAKAESLADLAEQVDLDQDPSFISNYVGSMVLEPEISNKFIAN